MAAPYPTAPQPVYDAAAQQYPTNYPTSSQYDTDLAYAGADFSDNPHVQNPHFVQYQGGYNPAALQGNQPRYSATQASLEPSRSPAYQYDYQYRSASAAGFHPGDVRGAVRPAAPSPAPQDPFRDQAGNDAFRAGYSGAERPPSERSRFSTFAEKGELYDFAAAAAAGRQRRKRILWIVLAVVLAILAAVGVAVYFVVIRPKQASPPAKPNSAVKGTNSTSHAPIALAITGTDGSVITTEDGTQFTYRNQFGGHWVADPANPLDNSARAQSYTAPLSQRWNYGVDRIRGVNIGGWLVLEPFITPALYERYPTAVDEFTLSTAMAADTANGGLKQIEQHYKTFITEQDFAEIAGAGLNWVRIPIPFWAIETWSNGFNGENEPYLAKVSWTYFLKAIAWARKYGLRINLDFHSAPGSQNGFNHSGKLGDINFLNGIMGVANAQRTITYLQIVAQFISQPQYRDVIPMFSILNEAFSPTIGQEALESFYLEAYTAVRQITGVGEGNGPMLAIHDGFTALSSWAGVYPNADRLALDTHQYFAFATQQSAAPLASFIQQPCNAFQPSVTQSMQQFGMTFAGEFSLAINDCGLNVNGVGLGNRFEGTFNGGTGPGVGTCAQFDEWENYSPQTKSELKQFALTQMDALQNFFFWTWKIGNSTAAGSVRAPFWSYKLGLEQGWMPADPRESVGACSAPGFSGPLQPWQTGGVGADQIPAATRAALPFPPATISNAGPAAALPSYTATGTAVTLPAPTFTSAPRVNAGDGIANDNAPVAAFVPIAGCAAYVDEYSGVGVPLPTALCGAQAPLVGQPVIPGAAAPQITAPPLPGGVVFGT